MATQEEAQKLFDDNKGLAIHTAYAKYSKFMGTGIDDLLQEAYFALWNAALSFDSTRGVKFSSYALPYIIAAVASAARDSVNPLVYYPKSIKTLASKLLKKYGSLDAIMQTPSLYEDFPQHTKESLLGAIQFLGGTISLSASNEDGEEFCLLDIIPDTSPSFVEDIEANSTIEMIMKILDEEEKHIFRLLLDNEKEKLKHYSQTKIIKVRHKALKVYEATGGTS